MSVFPAVTLPGTEVRTLSSSHVDQEFRLSIALPYSYQDEPDRTYPTIYLLDANWNFGQVTEMSRMMNFCKEFPEVIIVGIGYPVEGSLEQVFKHVLTLRTRDYTPVVDKDWELRQKEAWSLDQLETGAAASFLSFLKEELIPFAESAYRCDPSLRTLAGHSFGGLFTLFTLFHQFDLFQHYLAASPSLAFADRPVFSYEKTYADNHNDLPSSLYLSVGKEEEDIDAGMVSELFRLVVTLKSRQYSGLNITHQVFDDLNHCESIAPGHQYGLKWLLGYLAEGVEEIQE